MSTEKGTTVMVQGRIVWVSGDLFKGKVQTIFGTNQPKLDAQGKTRNEYGFGLAIPKQILAQTGTGQPGEIWAVLHAEAMKLFPSGQIPPSFAMKYKDGDGIDDKGIPFSQREGYAGHIVLSCTTTLPIKFFRSETINETTTHFQINEGIKCGDYVNVQVNVKAHGAIGQGKAGLYVNPNAVQFLGYGKEIINTPSGEAIFGNAAPALPPGASATPLAQPGFIAPPAAPMHQGTPFPTSQPAYQQPAPAAPIQPHYGVLPQIHQPAPAAAPQMPQPGYAPAPQQPQIPGMPPVPGYPGQGQ